MLIQQPRVGVRLVAAAVAPAHSTPQHIAATNAAAASLGLSSLPSDGIYVSQECAANDQNKQGLAFRKGIIPSLILLQRLIPFQSFAAGQNANLHSQRSLE